MDMEFPKRRTRPRLRAGPVVTGLRLFAVATILVSFAITLIILISGTWTQDGGDKKRIGMVNLSIINFDGIIPVDDKSFKNDYKVKMHWFMSGFGFEYPTAPNKDQTAGLIYTGPARTLRLPDHLRDIAQRLNLPATQYACIRTGLGTCSNYFFNKFIRHTYSTMTVVAWICYVYDLVILLMLLSYEVIITARPHWLRCRCWCLSGVCPCPKGGRDEIEELPPHFWDKFRVWWYLLALFSVLCSTVFVMVWGGLLLGYLRARDVPARFGAGFLAMSWGGVIGVAAGTAAILVRKGRNYRAWREWENSCRIVEDDEFQPFGGLGIHQPQAQQAGGSSGLGAPLPPPYMYEIAKPMEAAKAPADSRAESRVPNTPPRL